MVNPLKAKDKAMSSDGRKMANELEELNWQIQMKQYELHFLNCQYVIKNSEYKKFIGYELNEKELADYKQAEEDLKHGCTL